MPRRPSPTPKDHVAVRLEHEVIARIDALAGPLSTEWHKATRSDALRAVILRGIARMEEARQKKPSR